jgi:hypothetical protein
MRPRVITCAIICTLSGSIPVPLSEARAAEYHLPPDSTLPIPLQSGDVLHVYDGSFWGPYFAAANGSTVNVYGGEAILTIGNFHAGSELNIFDGSIEGPLMLNGEVNLHDGFLGGYSDMFGVLNMYGGSTGPSINFNEVNLFGGHFDAGYRGANNSKLNIHGHSFVLEGLSIDDIAPGEMRVITERDVTLSGVLIDGTAFSYSLVVDQNSLLSNGELSPTSQVTITMAVPEPGAVLLGAVALILLSLKWSFWKAAA